MMGDFSDEDAGEDLGQFASPPCFMHELDPSYQLDSSCSATPREQQDRDGHRCRKSERDRLSPARLALNTEERAEQDRGAACHLDAT